MVGENGFPETPDWRPEPRPCPVFYLMSRVKRVEVEVPPNIELGTN